MKLLPKLLLSHFFIGAATLTLMSGLTYEVARQAVVERGLQQLASVRSAKKSEVSAYWTHPLTGLGNLAAQLAENDQNLPEKLSFYKQAYNLQAIIAVDTNRKILAASLPDTVFLSKLAYSDGTIHNKLSTAFDGGKIGSHLTDFQFLSAADSSPVVLASAPIVRDQQTRGVIIALLSSEGMNQILNRRTGLGESGETYLVGADSLMRSESRFINHGVLLRLPVRTTAALAAIRGETGQMLTKDYRGVTVLSAYEPMQIAGVEWLILSEIDLDEVVAPINLLFYRMAAIAIVLAILIIITSYLISRYTGQPIISFRNILLDLSKGVWPSPVSPLHKIKRQSDEIGQMGQAIERLIQSLDHTAEFALAVGQGKFNEPFQPLSDTDRLGKAVLEMQRSLAESEKLVLKQRAEIERLAAEKLAQEINEGRIKSRSLIEGQEQERARISRELHDGISQLLTVIQMKVSLMRNLAPNESIEDISKLIEETSVEIRRLANNLMPSVLIDFGLAPALKRFAKITEKSTQFRVIVEYEIDEGRRFDREIEIALFRIVQEASHNAIKYAQTDYIHARLYESRPNYVALTITDDGVGFDTNAKPIEGHGLRNMAQRADLLNGTFKIESAIGRGTVIQAEFPINGALNGGNPFYFFSKP